MSLDVFSSMSNFAGSAINTAGGIYNNEKQIKANKALQEDSQKFNAQQAQLDRDFQSKQAELAYEREVDFYEQYKSPTAQVQAYQDAGLNPALLAGGMQATSSPSASAPSGATASSHANSVNLSNPFAFVEKAFDFAGLKEALEAAKIDNDIKREEREKLQIENEYREQQEALRTEAIAAANKLTYTQIEETKKHIEVHENSIAVGNSVIEVNASQATLNAAKTAMENMQIEQFEQIAPLLVEYQTAQNEQVRADTALKIAQTAGVQAATSKTETDEDLSVAGEVREGIVDTVTTGVLIADFVGEVLGVQDMGQRWTETREVRNKDGKVVRTEKRTKDGQGRTTTKKKRRRR